MELSVEDLKRILNALYFLENDFGWDPEDAELAERIKLVVGDNTE